jgi:uncharacterized protein
MDEMLPLFPLKLVAYPGEHLHLHIFEPRYIQLVSDVLAGDRVFGIPVYINTVMEYGTAVEIEEVIKTYSDGSMDIRTLGRSVIVIKQFLNPMLGKLYAGGRVEYVANINDGDPLLEEEIRKGIEHLLSSEQSIGRVHIQPNLSTYRIGHIIGLTLDQEYQLLKISSEYRRQKYVLQQLEVVIPEIDRLVEMKRRINSNGHFRKQDPLQF